MWLVMRAFIRKLLYLEHVLVYFQLLIVEGDVVCSFVVCLFLEELRGDGLDAL